MFETLNVWNLEYSEFMSVETFEIFLIGILVGLTIGVAVCVLWYEGGKCIETRHETGVRGCRKE